MEPEVPFFCGEAVVSYRVTDVTELERKANPTFVLRFVSLRFPLLRFTSCCFALLRVTSCCSALLHFASWERSGLVLGFRSVLLDVASFRCASFCLALLRFVSLWSAAFCSLRFDLLGFAGLSLCFASFRFASLRFASFCWDLLSFASLSFLRAVCERSGNDLGSFWERLGRYFRRSGELKRASWERLENKSVLRASKIEKSFKNQ